MSFVPHLQSPRSLNVFRRENLEIWPSNYHKYPKNFEFISKFAIAMLTNFFGHGSKNHVCLISKLRKETDSLL